MVNSNLEMKWNKIGRNLRTIGGLLFFVIIPYIAFVALTIQLILTIVLIVDITEINKELKNPQLNEFRSRYLAASIIKFAGALILHIAFAILVGIHFIGFYGPIFPTPYYRPFLRFIPVIVLYIIGFILMMVGSSVEMGAWSNLKSFITQNREIFPNNGKDAIDGVEKLHTGSMLWALGILIVPIVIGWIFQMIGYSTLSKIATQQQPISKEPISPIKQQVVYVSAPDPAPAPKPVVISAPIKSADDDIKFCPLCGAKASGQGLYCGECGTQIRD